MNKEKGVGRLKRMTFFIWSLIAVLTVSSRGMAQNLYWTFDDKQEPVTIPPECDARFDEVRGGVFVPSTEEVYQYGVNFLNSTIESVRKQSPYCFLVAALEGHTLAQLELARMYNEGKYLPQDDLSAYKWSFIAALDGNEDAEKFALTLEQFLSNEDLTNTTSAIQSTRIQIQTAIQKRKDAEQQAILAEQQNNADKIEKIVKDQLNNARAGAENAGNGVAPEAGGIVAPNALLNIFGEEDRLK